jgi:small acid-soluble spore protein P (minor)
MSKPDTIPVPESNPPEHSEQREPKRNQEPLSGSKKVKQANHSRHNNGEG